MTVQFEQVGITEGFYRWPKSCLCFLCPLKKGVLIVQQHCSSVYLRPVGLLVFNLYEGTVWLSTDLDLEEF